MLPESWKKQIDDSIDQKAEATQEDWKRQQNEDSSTTARSLDALGNKFDAYAEHQNRAEGGKQRREILTIIGLFVTAFITLVQGVVLILQWRALSSTDEAMHTQANVMLGQLNEMQSARRPWLALQTNIIGPLTFGPPTQVQLQTVLMNIGQSPAFDAWSNISLFPAKADTNAPDEMHRRCIERRQRMLEAQSQSKHIGYTLFPTERFANAPNAIVDPREYDEWKSSKLGSQGYLMLYLVVCGDYRSSFSPDVHSTQNLYVVGTSIDAQSGNNNVLLRLNMGSTIEQKSLGLIQGPFGTTYAD